MSNRQRSYVAEPQDTRDYRATSERLLKERFEAQPDERKRETRERVKLLLKERRNSYLARIAKPVYGVSLDSI